ncbi:MAG: outer membrane lipoprotein-sorting protein [Ignavibacteria bacterium]
MKNHKILFTLIYIFSFTTALFSQSADDIIDRYVQAIGGYDKVDAIKTVKIQAGYSRGGMDVQFNETIKRPDKILIEVTMQGMTQKRAYDGNSAWMLNPFRGSKDVEKLNKENTQGLMEQAHFEGPLINYKEKGSTVELLGKDDFEGTDVYKINLTDKDGTLHTFLIDADTYLLLKEITKRKIGEKEIKSETIYGDYRQEDGLMMPHSLQVGSPGRYQEQTIKKVEFNIQVDDGIFSTPVNQP